MMTIKVYHSGMDGWVWEIRRGSTLVAGGHGATQEDCQRQATRNQFIAKKMVVDGWYGWAVWDTINREVIETCPTYYNARRMARELNAQ